MEGVLLLLLVIAMLYRLLNDAASSFFTSRSSFPFSFLALVEAVIAIYKISPRYLGVL